MVVITGASRGIGSYLLSYFCQRGDKCLGIRRTRSGGPENGSSVESVDVTDVEAVTCWVEKHRDELRRIVLINCAGITDTAMAHKAHTDIWNRVVEVNLFGAFNMIQAVLPQMREEQWGRIINLSSVVAQIGIPGTSAYAASKAALWGMTKSLVSENARKGITINVLNLGYFDIGMISEVPESLRRRLFDQIPCGSFGNPRNIANAIDFLINSEYVNGAAIDINGGLR